MLLRICLPRRCGTFLLGCITLLYPLFLTPHLRADTPAVGNNHTSTRPLAPIDRLTPRERHPDISKQSRCSLGPAMPRAFHYGGRQAVRDLQGYLHVTWEDPTYMYHYYVHSLDTLVVDFVDNHGRGAGRSGA